MRTTSELITEARRSGRPAPEVGLTQDMLQQYQRDWQQLRRPPLAVPSGLDEALNTLLALGLIAPLPSPDTDECDRALFGASLDRGRSDHSRR